MTLFLKAQKLATNFKTILEENKFICTIPIKKNYNYEFYAEKNEIRNKVMIFFGKKGIKSVVQGDYNSREYKEIKALVSENYSLEFDQQSKQQYENYCFFCSIL